jgi:hypothetical protein
MDWEEIGDVVCHFKKLLIVQVGMRRLILLLLTILLTTISFAQDRKDLAVSFSTGVLTSPYYPNDKARSYYNVDFDYYLAKRHILSANFNAGKHNYYDNVLSNTAIPFYENNTNAEALYRTFSILYKFKFVNSKVFSANIGAGAGIMTHIREYWYKEANSAEGFRQSSWTDLVFPVRLDLDYKLSRRFHLGVIGGLFVHPDYPILGYHAGPRVSYIF